VKTIPVAQEHVGDEEAHKGDTTPDNDPEVGAPDPHYWLDPVRMIGVTDQIAAELTALDPGGKDTFAKNAATVKASLQALDASIAARAKAWTKRTIVTFHGSMSYYSVRYNLNVAAVIEPLAGKEPTPAYIGQVLTAIKATSATALFSEPQFDRAPAETIAREANIPLGELDPVGGLSGRDSYEALLGWNTDHLEQLLK
jgi:zinc transport system substrate-binding protein